MARVPTAANIPGVDPGVARDPGLNVTAEDFGAQDGRDLVNLGNLGFQEAEKRVRKLDEIEQRAFEAEVSTELMVEFAKAQNELREKDDESAAGFGERLQAKFEDTRNRVLQASRAKFPAREETFERVAAASKQRAAIAYAGALPRIHNARVGRLTEEFEAQMTQSELHVRRNPGALPVAIATMRGVLDKRRDVLPADKEREIERNLEKRLTFHSIAGQIDGGNPGSVLKALKAGDFDKSGLSAADVIRLTKSAEAKQKALAAAASAKLGNDRRAYLEGLFSGGLERSEATEARLGVGGKPGRKFLQSVQVISGARAEALEIANLPGSQIAGRIQALQPGANDPNLGARSRHQKLVGKILSPLLAKREKDPAAFVSPVVDAGIRDVTAIGGPLSGQDEARERARLTLRAQRKRGILAPRVLTNGQASETVQKLIAPGTEPQQKADGIVALAQTFGPLWPQVYGELVKQGLPGGEIVLGSMTRPGQARARVAMAEALTTGKKTLRANLEGKQPGDIDAAVETEMREFKQTLARVPKGNGTFAQYAESVRLLAYKYASEGTSPDEAAERAFKDVVGDHYEFAGSYRVPSQFVLDDVEFTAGERMAQLEKDKIAAPLSLDPRLQEAERREQYIKTIRDRGYWITNSDESGLILFDGQGRTVFDGDGLPIEIKFDGLKESPEFELLAP